MSIWKYQYFVDVIDLKSFTKAGKKNYVSQTAISQQILQLEKSVGGKLINRGNGEVTPTQMGELVYKRASEMLRIDEQLLREIEEMKVSSVLRVGIDSSINKSFWGIMQNILDSYYEEEGFRFSKLDYTTGSMMLDRNDLDIYISYGLDIKNENPNIREILLCSNRMGVYTSDRFGDSFGEISRDFQAGKRILKFDDLSRYTGYATWSYPCSTRILDLKDVPDFVKDVKMTGNLETLSLKVEMNNGYAFADSRFFSFCTGEMSFVEGMTQVCNLKLFYRRDSLEKEKFLMDFIGKVREAVCNLQ